METDLIHVRRWLFQDFKARVSLLIPPLLKGNPEMRAFDLIAAVEILEAPLPLGPERKAFLLDQYLVHRWAGETPTTPVLPRRRPRNPVSPRSTKVTLRS